MDEYAILFIRMKDGHNYCKELSSRIRQAIQKQLSTQHVPHLIMEIKDIPAIITFGINGMVRHLVRVGEVECFLRELCLLPGENGESQSSSPVIHVSKTPFPHSGNEKCK
ncbi:hypothetical protein NPIL_335601 [Nephila pilipes]|uniref:Uncharacterized protein n=1 Tax=Nephila pilipes TaxID=299642 RepID=A0A8X6P3I9_NEPPI|nr:hypothetical protein NPIL_335601 [Nephila pilipes]